MAVGLADLSPRVSDPWAGFGAHLATEVAPLYCGATPGDFGKVRQPATNGKDRMSGDELRYDQMVEQALRGVVREALELAAERGLPGDHHFYITFRTDHPGIEIPNSLRERYPSEMTIVLQHQFWNLEVGPDSFEITLSFSNVPHRMVIPYAAMINFADPSVRFGLQFDGDSEGGGSAEEDGSAAHRVAVPKSKGKAAGPAPAEERKAADKDDTKIVTLDSFRKK